MGRDWIEMGRELDRELHELRVELALFAMEVFPAAPIDWTTPGLSPEDVVDVADPDLVKRLRARLHHRRYRATWYADGLAALRGHHRDVSKFPDLDYDGWDDDPPFDDETVELIERDHRARDEKEGRPAK